VGNGQSSRQSARGARAGGAHTAFRGTRTHARTHACMHRHRYCDRGRGRCSVDGVERGEGRARARDLAHDDADARHAEPPRSVGRPQPAHSGTRSSKWDSRRSKWDSRLSQPAHSGAQSSVRAAQAHRIRCGLACHQDWGSPLPPLHGRHICAGTAAHPAHICAKAGLTLPHLHRNWAHPATSVRRDRGGPQRVDARHKEELGTGGRAPRCNGARRIVRVVRRIVRV
jgi:hypothetical protein